MVPLVDQLIRTSFPHPVAAAWHRIALSSSSADRTKRLLACVEVLVRVLCAVLLPDYLRGPPDDAVEKTLVRLDRPALGHWVQLLRSLIRALAVREQPAPFIPEAITWYLAKDRPTDAAKRLDELVEVRNDEAHGRPLSEAEQDERAAELLSRLRAVMSDVSFLGAYRPFRTRSATLSRRGGFSGQLQFLVGTVSESAPIAGTWPARLFDEAVYLSNPGGSEVLEVSPFLCVMHDPGPKEDRVFVLAGTHKSKKLVLKNDASGTTETQLVTTPDGDVAFDAWLERRNQLSLWQSNAGASEHFAAAPVADGEVLAGRFHVRGTLGEGGMATVLRVWDQWDEREFALKVLHSQLAVDPHFKERFRREARTMKRLRHPNVLAVEETGQLEDGRLYLKLPLLPGGTLEDRVKAGASPPELVEAWAIEMVSAVSYLHEQKVVHRDIKPSNFLLDDEGHPLLSDFGIALAQEDVRLTRTLEQMGSVAYMSPEQRRGGAVSPASDLYSLGVVLHELATGVEGGVNPGKGVAGRLGALIRDLCAEDPTDRPDAAQALARLREGKEPAPPAPPVGPPPVSVALARYHVHLADGSREVLGLQEVVRRAAAEPTAVVAVWQPGWTAWRDPREVDELAASWPVSAPAGPPAAIPGAPEARAKPAGPVHVELASVDAGTFAMTPSRQVALSAFRVSARISVATWSDVLGAAAAVGAPAGDPIDHLSWFDAVRFCIALCERCELPSPYAFGPPRPRKQYGIDDIGRMLREVVPFKKVPAILSHFGREALTVMQFEPERLADVPGIGGRTAAGYAEKWDRERYFVRDVVWDRAAAGFRLPTEAEWVRAAAVSPLDPVGEGDPLEWVWDADSGPVYQQAAMPLEDGAFADPATDDGPRRIVRGPGGIRRALSPEHTQERLGLRIVRGPAD